MKTKLKRWIDSQSHVFALRVNAEILSRMNARVERDRGIVWIGNEKWYIYKYDYMRDQFLIY